MEPILGASKTAQLIEWINGLGAVEDIRALRSLHTT
jgi:hypothetical protein